MTHHLHMRMLGHRVMRYAGITLGCLIASSAINLFLVPAHLLTGGATGIAMIVYYLFGLPIGLQTFVYNIPLLFMAWKLMGRAYTVDIIIGTAIFSFLLDLTRPLNAYAPVNDMMRKKAGTKKGSGKPHSDKVGKITRAQLQEIAEAKKDQLNAIDIEGAMKVIAGSARSMGVEVVD